MSRCAADSVGMTCIVIVSLRKVVHATYPRSGFGAHMVTDTPPYVHGLPFTIGPTTLLTPKMMIHTWAMWVPQAGRQPFKSVTTAVPASAAYPLFVDTRSEKCDRQ